MNINKRIFLSTSIETCLKTHEPGKVIWLNFKCKNGSSAMINLNNLALERVSVARKAMQGAIEEYLKGE